MNQTNTDASRPASWARIVGGGLVLSLVILPVLFCDLLPAGVFLFFAAGMSVEAVLGYGIGLGGIFYMPIAIVVPAIGTLVVADLIWFVTLAMAKRANPSSHGTSVVIVALGLVQSALSLPVIWGTLFVAAFMVVWFDPTRAPLPSLSLDEAQIDSLVNWGLVLISICSLIVAAALSIPFFVLAVLALPRAGRPTVRAAPTGTGAGMAESIAPGKPSENASERADQDRGQG